VTRITGSVGSLITWKRSVRLSTKGLGQTCTFRMLTRWPCVPDTILTSTVRCGASCSSESGALDSESLPSSPSWCFDSPPPPILTPVVHHIVTGVQYRVVARVQCMGNGNNVRPYFTRSIRNDATQSAATTPV
jgi:hypothetical protein